MDLGGTASIAAAAAVVGAGLGAFGAVRAAKNTGNSQRRSQHEHWRRQTRADAYAQFVNATEELAPVMSALVRMEDSAPADLPERAAEARRLMSALAKANNAVALAGPDSVAAEAMSVARAYGLTLRGTLVRLGLEQARRGDPPPSAHWPSLSHFRELARAALDDPDGALEQQP
ncbi:hypothetical protein GCM10009575_035560 [Streptomyces rhizosphaericus]|uniref:Proline dehydrogenase n=1 Tax=Streptomyces rhizosphaericus TaxID=114699 RepID=A0ABN1PNX0_9ACTN